MLNKSNELCGILNETYNANFLKEYPNINNIFYDVRDMYEKSPEKFPNANKTFMSLINNLENPEKQPIVDYITGPGYISKLISTKYNKVIYIFGENDHSNETGCIQASKTRQVDLYHKKHIGIEKYLLDLFKNSPVFIDFYVEFGIMLDRLEHISTTSGQTLWDMLSQMKGCFGPLINRDCPYNVRMHGTDARSVLSNKYKSSVLTKMSTDLMMDQVLSKRGKSYIEVDVFKKIYKDQIKIMSKIKNKYDMINIMKEDIERNQVIMKELKRSILPKKQIIQFFLYTELDKTLTKIGYNPESVGKWFKILESGQKLPIGHKWPLETEWVSYMITAMNAVIMDVYTAARMFKVFKVKENQHYPKEQHNIIYYAGSGHTIPMTSFLENIGFNLIEQSDDKVLSCVCMKGIKQPLFS